MRQFIIFFTCIILFFNSSQAQKKEGKIKFGKVNIEELKQTQCEYAPDANAEILLSKGDLRITLGRVNFFVHKRFKIYANEGKNYATVKIPIYEPEGERIEFIKGLKAVCYNLENGKIVETKLKANDKFETRKNDFYKEISFVIPNVKIGSVFEYSYTIESQNYMYVPDWQIQFDIPVALNTFKYQIDEEFSYNVYSSGYVSGLKTENANGIISVFNANTDKLYSKNVLPIYDEPYQPNPDDLYGKINFQLVKIEGTIIQDSSSYNQVSNDYSPEAQHIVRDFSSDYNALNRQLLRSDFFGLGLDNNGCLKPLNLSKKTPDIEFAIEIFDQLRDNVSWNEYKGVTSEFYGRQFIVSKKPGTVADINLTLTTALKEAGFNAAPVLISTRGNGTPHPFFADIKRFDYVLTGLEIDGSWILLDATSNLPFGELEHSVLNAEGYIIHPTANGWINLKKGRRAVNSIFIEATIKDNVYTENVSVKYTKYNAYSKITQIIEEGVEAFKEDFVGDYEGEIKDLTISEANYNEPLVVKFTSSKTIPSDNILYIEPINFNDIKKNPFEREKRYSNLNFPFSISEKVIYKLNVDENWVAEPIESQRYTLENKKGVFNYLYSVNDNSIDIISDLSLRETFFTVEEYPALKQFFEGYTTLQNELLVVKRK